MIFITFLAIVWAGTCGAFDVNRGQIPNILTIPAIVAGMVSLLLTQNALIGSATILNTALAATLAVILTLPGFALRQLGGGDVKMLLAIALMAGIAPTLTAFVVASLSVAVAFLARMLSNGEGRRTLPTNPEARSVPSRVRLRYGPGLAAGFIGHLLYSAFFASA
ncbi:prepilin peptidase [Thioalkalivibrio sp. ALE28]|uniref:A24 family peptidase n=1 Tax=Thioalkalivibrio sp. ALE28 TaxID=1158179 RepID=UPI000368EFA8|nr:A24 family peptidase [Thioalkalivibrio sp. ALE28]